GRGAIDDDTRLVLTNAIYFKGKWDRPFNKAGTQDEDWFGPAGTRQVPMMHQRGDFWYYEEGTFQALDIPYEDLRLSLLVVLPRKQDGLAALESRWAGGSTYQQVTSGLNDAKVVLSLPRFKLEAEFKLKPVLGALGAALAFSDEADFTGISDE